MRPHLPKACRVLPLAFAAACSEVPERIEAPGASVTGQARQVVPYTPSAPAGDTLPDGATDMGPVEVPGRVRTRFTTRPQSFSFHLGVRAGARVRLEVTHLGSSMFLDTRLSVYGPKLAESGYGTTPLAQDEDSGYGQLSRIDAVTLEQGGDYLVVVSSDSGVGKQFGLQVDCLQGVCH